MYHAHFGLTRGLFGEGIATEAGVFRSPRHDELIDRFKLAFGSTSSALVLRGPAGVGKTTLTASALRATSTRLALAWVNGVPTNGTELLELILVELGIGTLNTTRIERLQLWRQLQGELRATDSRLFVVVERAEDLSADVLHALDQLTAPDAAGNLGANLVLIGHASLDPHLAAPVLDSLRQRIRVRADLAPFTEAELQDYLRHQVACADGHFDRVFAPGAIAALYRYTNGVVRLANTLCETALDIAAEEEHELLTAELIARTATKVLGLVETPEALEKRSTTASASAAPAFSEAPPLAAAVASPPSEPRPASAAAPAAETPAAKPEAVTVARAAAPQPSPQTSLPSAAPPTSTTLQSVVARQTTTPALSAAPALPPKPVTPAAPTLVTPAAPPVESIFATATPPPAPPKEAVEMEYDGGATDVSDVGLMDFPVLTDAVDPLEVAAAAKPVPPSPMPVTPKPIPRPASRMETAYVAAKPAAKPSPPPADAVPAIGAPATPPASMPTPKATAPAAASAANPFADSEADDALRQTQTMRAISVAKSIDDISSSMAETLFGDAELDLLTAALASAAEWTEDAPEPAPPPSPEHKSEPVKTALADDDPFDLFGLGDDAPLELIDDSTLPPANRPRRTAAS